MDIWSFSQIEYGEKIRFLLKDKPELKNTDVLIFHNPYDTALLKWIDKPCLLYEHRAVRPFTFAWNYEKRALNPLNAWIKGLDRDKILKFFKKLYQRPDVIVCNSKFIQGQLKKWFNVKAFVVNPPVDLEKFKPKKKKREYFLSFQRIDWQKRPQIQIEAFMGIKEKLKIVAPCANKDLRTKLEYICRRYPNIDFLGEVREKELIRLIQGAKAVIQTGIMEDFGLVPVESMACGIPNIVIDEAGFKETINRPELGVRIKKPYIASLRQAIKNFDLSKYDNKVLRKEAQKYGMKRFEKELKKYIDLAIKRYGNKKSKS